jgi:hypothetical protein
VWKKNIIGEKTKEEKKKTMTHPPQKFLREQGDQRVLTGG